MLAVAEASRFRPVGGKSGGGFGMPVSAGCRRCARGVAASSLLSREGVGRRTAGRVVERDARCAATVISAACRGPGPALPRATPRLPRHVYSPMSCGTGGGRRNPAARGGHSWPRLAALSRGARGARPAPRSSSPAAASIPLPAPRFTVSLPSVLQARWPLSRHDSSRDVTRCLAHLAPESRCRARGTAVARSERSEDRARGWEAAGQAFLFEVAQGRHEDEGATAVGCHWQRGQAPAKCAVGRPVTPPCVAGSLP